jgi:ribosomal protein S18 acetylase RimI-like enzyme
MKSENDFQGLYEKKELLGVIEIAQKLNSVHLQSLVVDPNHFRKGIATKLINKVFDLYPSTTYTVETGNSNIPAKKLYESLGFKKYKVWIAEFGIEKIKYEKK